jgi:hypothetical protein
MLRRILVGDNERVLVIRKRRFAEILEPGERWIFTLAQEIELERYNVRDLVYAGEWADYIVSSRSGFAWSVNDRSRSNVSSFDGRHAQEKGRRPSR